MKNPHDLVESVTNNTFSDLLSINRNFVQILDEELTKVQPFPEATNGRTAGMAVVLRAFEVDSGFNLLSGFRNLQADDLNLVRKIIQGSIPSQSSDLPILKRLLEMPRIPEQQVALNEIIQKADPYSSIFRGFSTEGAATMYQILSHLWPKLSTYPPPPPPPIAS